MTRRYTLHPDSLFLSQFKSIVQQLTSDPAEKINQLALLLSENKTFLDESSDTVNMIDALSETIENNFSLPMLNVLKIALFNFWQKLLLARKMDVFFLGNEENATYFFGFLDKEKVGELFYIKVGSDGDIPVDILSAPLSNSCHPVIIYDHGADAINHLPEAQGAVLVADFQQIMMLKALPYTSEQDAFVSFLQHKHNLVLMKKSPTLIIGNSYGYYSLPKNCLSKATNLSMHSLDLRQAQTMMRHYASSKKTKTIILMSGYFDLFFELAKTREEDNIRVVHIMSHYNHKNRIIPNNDITNDLLDNSDEALLAHYLPALNHLERLSEFHQLLEDTGRINHLSDQLEIQINSTASPDPALFEANAQHRALRHSKSYKYKKSKQVNQQILHEMCALAQEKGIRIHYVIPPFPAAYLQNIEPAMVLESRAFLKSIESYHFTLHDFNDEKPFSRTDYRDGDHLNYHGAVKLVKALKKRGVVL